MYINRIEFATNAHVQEKLNYFCDAVELLSEPIGLPGFPVNSNTRLLVSGLRKLAETDIHDSHRREYLRCYYEWNKHLLKPEGVLLQKFKSSLDTLLKKFEAFKSDDKKPIKFILQPLRKVEAELNKDYFSHTVDELKRVLLCSEPLNVHDHKKVLDEVSRIYVSEFLFFGMSSLEVRKIFQEAIDQYREKIKESSRQYVYDIPVPESIHKLRNTVSYRKYKAEVSKYLRQWGINKQVDNILYIWQNAVKPKTFIFRISNYYFDQGITIKYDNCYFATSVTDRHKRYFNRDAKKFLKSGKDYIFCEVTVESGSDGRALHRAVADIKLALNYLNYHMADKIKQNLKPYAEVFQYILIKDHSTINTQHYRVRITSLDLPYLNELSDLRKLINNSAVSTYLKLDKIVMEGLAADTKELAYSQYWRYCESLFVGEKEAKDIRERLVNYYAPKSGHQLLIGLQLMIQYFNNTILQDQRTEELGYTRDQFHELIRSSLTSLEAHVKQFVPILKNPVLNKYYRTFSKMNAERASKEILNHYEKVLKSCYIQRNLYQHSNIVIPELQEIWYRSMEQFCVSIRSHIINNLTQKPKVKEIEALFNNTKK